MSMVHFTTEAHVDTHGLGCCLQVMLIFMYAEGLAPPLNSTSALTHVYTYIHTYMLNK